MTNSRTKQPLRDRLRQLFAGTEGESVVAAAPLLPAMGIFRWAWPYMRPYRGLLLLSVVLAILVPLFQAARLYMVKLVVDEVLVPQDLDPLVWIAVLTLGLTVLTGVTQFFDSYIGSWVGQRFILSMRTDFFRHLQGLSLDFFERHRLGDILARIVGDIRAIESFLLTGMNKVISSLFTAVIFTGMLFYLDWQLALIVIVIAPAFALLIRLLTRLVRRASRERQRRTGVATAFAEESLSNIALVQAYNRQDMEIERFHRESDEAFRASLIVTRLKALVPIIVDTVQAVSTLAVLAFGTLALQDGRLTVGGLLVFIAYLSQLYLPLRQLAVYYNTIAGATAGAERVIEFFEHRPTIVDRPDAAPFTAVRGEVEFDSVSFCYPGADKNAVQDVSLRVEPGETVALVGRSGAGKTTLTKLLLRFYEVDAGAVRIDGHDVRDLQVNSLRDNIAILMQETLIFEGTIRENIRYGRPGASDEQVIQAARAADAHDFILSLPEGYDTLVGQKGRRLSGGQRQRIAIARAMIREATILILDEPTTGLDAESSQRIIEPLEKLMSGRTTIVISHSLITARRADRVVVLDQGRIVEEGAPDALAAEDGLFSRLLRANELGVAVGASDHS